MELHAVAVADVGRYHLVNVGSGDGQGLPVTVESDIIRRGAELVKELEAMNLSYTER